MERGIDVANVRSLDGFCLSLFAILPGVISCQVIIRDQRIWCANFGLKRLYSVGGWEVWSDEPADY